MHAFNVTTCLLRVYLGSKAHLLLMYSYVISCVHRSMAIAGQYLDIAQEGGFHLSFDMHFDLLVVAIETSNLISS